LVLEPEPEVEPEPAEPLLLLPDPIEPLLPLLLEPEPIDPLLPVEDPLELLFLCFFLVVVLPDWSVLLPD
jgi:hypothetical protein